MSNLPLQSRPPKYPLGPRGLFGGMAMPAPFGGSSPFKAVPNNNLQPPVPLTGGPIHGPAVKNTLLDVPNSQPTGPSHSTLLNTHIGLPHGVNPYENVSSHPADSTAVHQLPGGGLSSAPYQKPTPALAPPSTGVDYTTVPGGTSRHPATGPSQLTDFTTRPGMASQLNWQSHHQSQAPSSAMVGRAPTFATGQSYPAPPQNGTLPPSPLPPALSESKFSYQPPQTIASTAQDPNTRVLEHDPNPLQYKGKFAPHAQTLVSQWTPEMHRDFNASLSPETQLSMLNNQVRIENMNRDAANKIGMRGFGGMGGNSPAVTASQKAMIDPLVAQNQRQQMLNGLSASDAKQLKLGGAKAAVTPSLDESSPFWAGEGKTKRLPGNLETGRAGTTVVSRTGSIDGKPSRGSELIGAGAMDKLNAQGITAQDLANRKPGDATDLAFKQLQRESSTAQAKRLSEEGGGVSKARQYSDEQKDLRMLRHAQKHGNMGLKSVQEAAIRQERRMDNRGLKADTNDFFNPNGESISERLAARENAVNAPIGKNFYESVKGKTGLMGVSHEQALIDTLKEKLKDASPDDKKIYLNMVKNDPSINWSKNKNLEKYLKSISVGPEMKPPGSKKPEMPAETDVSGPTPSSITDMSGSAKGFSLSPSDRIAGNADRTPWDRMTMQNSEGLPPIAQFADMGLEGLRHLSGLSAYQSLPGWYKWATTPQKKK